MNRRSLSHPSVMVIVASGMPKSGTFLLERLQPTSVCSRAGHTLGASRSSPPVQHPDLTNGGLVPVRVDEYNPLRGD